MVVPIKCPLDIDEGLFCTLQTATLFVKAVMRHTIVHDAVAKCIGI